MSIDTKPGAPVWLIYFVLCRDRILPHDVNIMKSAHLGGGVVGACPGGSGPPATELVKTLVLLQ